MHSEPFANLDPKVGGTHDTLQEGKQSLEGKSLKATVAHWQNEARSSYSTADRVKQRLFICWVHENIWGKGKTISNRH